MTTLYRYDEMKRWWWENDPVLEAIIPGLYAAGMRPSTFDYLDDDYFAIREQCWAIKEGLA